MKTKFLIIEHNFNDIELIKHELRKGNDNYITEIVQTEQEYTTALDNFKPDIILSNYTLPTFNGLEALQIRERLAPQTPFIFISDSIGEENAVALIKCGGTDFVLKERLVTLSDKIYIALDEVKTVKSQAKQKKTEEKIIRELFQREAIYRTFFENSRDGKLLTVTQGQVLAANPAACKTFQMTEKEIIHAQRMNIVNLTEGRLKILSRETKRNDSAEIDLTLLSKDITSLTDEFKALVFQGTKGQLNTSNTVRDINRSEDFKLKISSEADKFQQKFENLNKILDSSLDIICTIDKEGKFVTVSAASERIWGYIPSELIGKKYIDFVFSEDARRTLDTDSNIQSGVPVTIFENRYVHKVGHIVPMLWSSKWDETDQLSYCIAKDASEKKKLEKAFEIERKHFIDLYLHAPSCMGIVKGSDYIYEIANPPYLKLIKKSNIIGKTVKEVSPELEAQGIFTFLDIVYKTGESFSAHEMLMQFDYFGNGHLVDTYLSFIFQAHRDSYGNIDGIFFFANDVTEQVLLRKKIVVSEKKYRYLFENNPMPMWITELNTLRFLEVNEMALQQYGYSREEFLSMTAFDIKPVEDKERFLYLYNSTDANKANSKKGIWSHIKKDGTIISVEITAKKIDYEGLKAKLVLSSDITDRRKAEFKLEVRNKEIREYKLALDESSIVGITDQNGIIIFANDNFCKISKYSREELIGQNHQIVNSGYHSEAYIQNKWNIIASGKTWKGEIKNKAKDGSFYWVDTTIVPFLDEQGKPYQFFATRFDITERKNADRILAKQNKELSVQYENRKNLTAELIIVNKELAFQNEEKESRALELIMSNNELLKTNSELDRFVYSVSHDLRSPLTSILGVLSFVERESAEPDTLEHVRMIRISITRLDAFIKNILSYSRNNRTGLEVEKISINETVHTIVDSLGSMNEAKGIHFEIDIKEQQPFFTDRLRFNTILENLISNAIKFHKRGESYRYIKIIGDSDHEKLQITIADNGIGIEPEHHQKIFDMFFRLSGIKDGSGIGLYIVKDTVKMLQGSIEIKSENDIGSHFTITLKNLKP